MEYKNIRKYVSPEIIFGNASRFLLPRYIRSFNLKSPLLVIGKSIEKSVWMKELSDLLQNEKIHFEVFSDVSPNPRDFQIEEGTKHYLEKNCDGIISLGGGSSMDCAKGIGILSSNGGQIHEFEGVDQISFPCPPMIFLPTTAGTGSDVSQFTIVNDTTHKRKFGIVSKAILPDVSLTDPELTVTMPDELTAACGMDVLTHAIEAYVSTGSSEYTDLLALKAIGLVTEFLFRSYQNPKNLQYREKMVFASMSAGLAFSNAGLGLVHAMAHSLGGYKDSPHGECNATLLPWSIKANFSSSKKRYTKILECFGADTSRMSETEIRDELANRITEMNVQMNIPTSLCHLKLTSGDIKTLSKFAAADACMVTNPAELKEADIRRIYESART